MLESRKNFQGNFRIEKLDGISVAPIKHRIADELRLKDTYPH